MTNNEIKKILIKINPELKKFLNTKINLLDNGYLDSFSIIRFIAEIEKNSKKNINFSKIKRTDFSTFDKIVKFINKKK